MAAIKPDQVRLDSYVDPDKIEYVRTHGGSQTHTAALRYARNKMR
jgi:hypothetical protein